jgi:hypothetical protein
MFDMETENKRDIQFSEVQKVTGYVLPVGNGAVGKSTLPAVLDSQNSQPPKTGKSVNLEFSFVTDQLIIRDQAYQVMQQYLVPPGQKENEGISGGRSFEQIIETYRFMIKQIDVILLSYKLVEVDSFNDLEFWVNRALEISNPMTQYILVGTHLDMDQSREVSTEMTSNGSAFIRECVQKKYPEWQGKVPALEISMTDKRNINLLRNAVSVGILRSRKILG